MANEIEISKREQMLVTAKQRLVAIERAPRATNTEAAKAVNILVASYPMTPPAHPEVYMEQVCRLLAGASSEAVMALVDPNRGIVGQCTFLPSIAEIRKWLDEFQATSRAIARQLVNEIQTLEPPDEPAAPTEEERARRVEAARSFMKPKQPALSDLEWLKPEEQRSAQERKMEERFKRTQRSVPELAMEALKNLENSRGGG